MNCLRTVTLAGLLIGSVAYAGPFQNGSFELPGGGAGIRQQIGNDPSGFVVTGWQHNVAVTTGYEIYEATGVDGIPAGAGTYYISWGHNGTTGGTLQQTFDTLLGQAYSVTYLLATQQSGCGTCQQSNLVQAYNGTTLTAPNLLNGVTNAFLPPDGLWFSGMTLNFTATGTSTTLIFKDTTTDSFDNWALDNVAVNRAANGVPEPATYGLLGLGLAGLTAIRRFRR